ncbi:MAG TPA: gephyrin-like molybdotransferase Glp, partial [Chroococcidiopsis sp.]
MLQARDAETLIFNLVHPLESQQDVEAVDLLAAAGRVLAVPVVSQLDFPHWDNSAMDGYAVRFADVASGSAEQPVSLTVVEEIPAGYAPQRTIESGQAARILTGSMMPLGADTVVMQEDTVRQGDRVLICTTPKPQAFVRHRGAYYQAGAALLSPGVTLAAPEIAVLAAAQCTAVRVYRRPRVAILSTGSELVAPDQPLGPGQIVDSNQYALAALVQQAGAEPICLGVVPDHPDALKQAIAQAISTADFVLSSGGVSVGDYDYVDQILAELGASIHIRAVAVKPGKPLTVATFTGGSRPRSVLYFGLPGNPVSALVTFWRFVLPALRKFSGLADSWGPVWTKGRSLHPLRSDGKRESYVWGQLHSVNGDYEFHMATGSHWSGNLINLACTNALAMIPVGQTSIAAGDLVPILQIGAPIVRAR